MKKRKWTGWAMLDGNGKLWRNGDKSYGDIFPTKKALMDIMSERYVYEHRIVDNLIKVTITED